DGLGRGRILLGLVGIDRVLLRLEAAQAAQVHGLAGAESADDHPAGGGVGTRGQCAEGGVAVEVDEVVEHPLDRCPGPVWVPERAHWVGSTVQPVGLALLLLHRPLPHSPARRCRTTKSRDLLGDPRSSIPWAPTSGPKRARAAPSCRQTAEAWSPWRNVPRTIMRTPTTTSAAGRTQ